MKSWEVWAEIRTLALECQVAGVECQDAPSLELLEESISGYYHYIEGTKGLNSFLGLMDGHIVNFPTQM